MKCRPGDLALVLGDTVNSGLLVTVIRPYGGEDWLYDWEGPTWWVSCSAPLAWTIVEDGTDHVAHEGPMPDFCLFPIPGAGPKQHEREKVVECV